MRLVATCPEETKETLRRELEALGARELHEEFRAISFTAEPEVFYAVHLHLRTASRVLRIIKDVAAAHPQMLRSQVRRIHWHELFDVQHSFAVETLGDERQAKQVITQVREGVREAFERQCGRAPPVDGREPRVLVVAHVRQGRCTLSLDTCGKSLHKRGYRASGHPAPIKETLAASLLMLAGYDGTQAFMDPMCGSGTIAIEAAMLAVHKAPQIHRKKGDFAFEWLRDFDRELWRRAQEHARAAKLVEPGAPLVASDVEPRYVELARQSALAARVEKYLRFAVQRFQDAVPPAERGVLVTNLPYGERLATDDLRALYEEVGDTLKQRFQGWRAALLAVEASPHKFIGLKPARRIPILNGNIPCRLLIFDVYPGSRHPARALPGPAEGA